MTDEQYWHGDPKLLQIYYEVYMQRIHQEAHIYGYYQYKALEVALYNALSGLDGKRHKPLEYLQKPLITAERNNTQSITKENVVAKNRQGLQYQNNWLNSLSANK